MKLYGIISAWLDIYDVNVGNRLRALYVCGLISVFTSLDFYLKAPVKEAGRINKDIRRSEDLFN